MFPSATETGLMRMSQPTKRRTSCFDFEMSIPLEMRWRLKVLFVKFRERVHLGGGKGFVHACFDTSVSSSK